MMLEEFLDLLRNEMDDIQADYGAVSDSEKFAIWVGWKLFGLDPRRVVDDLILYVDDLSGVAALGYLDTDSDRANVVVCWYRREGDEEDVERVRELNGLWPKIKDGKLPATSAASEFLLELEDRGLAVDFVSYIAADVEFSRDAYDFAEEHSLHLVDLIRLKDAYIRMQHPLRLEEPEKLEFAVSGSQAFIGPQILAKDRSEEAIPTLVCALPLDLIHGWVSEFGNGLFAENLRLRLSEYDKRAFELEQSVQETILSAPQLMFVQNNGITITCARIELQPDDLVRVSDASEGLVTMYSPQIVNGCQTSWAIYHAIERSRTDNTQLPQGFVLTKIIQTQDSDLAQQITSASNRQNAIQPRDQKVKDERQVAISLGLARHAPNLGIYWDYRRGGWSNIVSRGQALHYYIKGHTKSYRKLDNGLAGQVILAMAGALHEAKNKGGRIFDSDSLYEIAFGYNLHPEERFADLPNSSLSSGGDNALGAYLDDLLFGLAVYQHAIAAFKWLYIDRDRQLKRGLDNTNSVQRRQELEKAIELISGREFVKYWAFDVVRLVHLVVEEWCTQGMKREGIRENLVNGLTVATNLDLLFLSKAKRPQWFRMESNLSLPNTLDRMKPSDQLPLLGVWFGSLEELGAEVIEKLREKEPNVSARTFILSRKTTHTALVELLEKKLKSAQFPRLFPPEGNG